jgi:hypothetical protein
MLKKSIAASMLMNMVLSGQKEVVFPSHVIVACFPRFDGCCLIVHAGNTFAAVDSHMFYVL